MKLENNSNMKTAIRYTYSTNDFDSAEPLHIIESNGNIKDNDKTYIVGLSDKANTPLRSQSALNRFEPKEIEVNGVTEYYWEKK